MTDSSADLILTPTQQLVLEVLAARLWLGESFWTFDSNVRPAVRLLASQGLVTWKSGMIEHTILVWPTPYAHDYMFGGKYRPPIWKHVKKKFRKRLRGSGVGA